MTKNYLLFVPFVCLVALFVLIAAPNAKGQSEPEETPVPQLNTRIVGGTVADDNEYPWQAALVSSGQFCGGSLIATDWVLSAAHCFYNQSGSQVTFPSNFDIFLGVNDLSDGVRRDVAQVVIHPNYDPGTQENDIALIRLVSAATLSCEVNTIRHAAPADNAKFAAGQTATVTGWGTLTSGGQSPNNLREVSLPIITNAVCSESYGNIPSSMLCAGLAAGGKDSCQGDSGGPLVVADGNDFIQAGVVSWGIGCAEAGNYGVYTRVSHYKSWIDGYLNSSRQVTSSFPAYDITLADSFVYLPLIATAGTAPGTQCTVTTTPPVSNTDSDTPGDAIAIGAGSTTNGAVSQSDLDDVFKINLTKGSNVVITLTGTGGDADLYLLPPGSTSVTDTATDLSTSNGNTEKIELTIPTTGQWYIDVYSAAGSTNYSLTLTVGS
ncbi:MAG: hypothetical protein ACI9EW_001630 [Cellvibrionaceae bacterium]|jgi:hypothetical protein